MPEYDSYGDALTLRFGDIYVPHLEMQEPLRLECQHFVDCVAHGRRPLSDGRNGLAVLRVLECCSNHSTVKGAWCDYDLRQGCIDPGARSRRL